MNLTPAEAKTWIEAFYKVIQKAGYEMIFYTYRPYADTHLPPGHMPGTLPLWLASYPRVFNINKLPKAPAGWKEWQIWQYTDKGIVKGIAQPVDLNLMNISFFNKY